MWDVQAEPVKRPGMIAYQVHGAIAWLVSGYFFVAIHALVGRALPARWLGGFLWGLGPNFGGVDTSRLMLPASGGRAALLGLTAIALTLLVALFLWWLGRRVESFLGRVWLTVIAYNAALSIGVSLLADSLWPLPGGDARLLTAGLATLWRALDHAWLLTPLALVLLLALIALVGQDLVRLASHLHPPGSDGFGSWALAPIGPGLILRCFWLGWAGWRLPQRWGLWAESFIWLLTLAALSLVAYNWSRRLRHQPVPEQADATGLLWFGGAGLIALAGLLLAFGISPVQDRVWVLSDPPTAVIQAAGTVTGNLSLEVDASGKVHYTLDLAMHPDGDPVAIRLAERIRQPDAVPQFWQSSAESLLRLALPGMSYGEIKPVKPIGAMWVAGAPTPASRRFSGTLPIPATDVTVALPADGDLRLDDLAISSAAPAVIVGLDGARQPVIQLSVAGGATYHYSRSTDGHYFLPGADNPPVRLSFFRIQKP